MVGLTQPDSILPSGDIFNENQKAIISRNISILSGSYIDHPLPENGKELTDAERFGASRGERMVKGNAMIEGIRIFYDTRIGAIRKPLRDDLQIKDGDYSILRTYLVEEDGKKKILVVYPKGWLSPHIVSAAVSGEPDELSSEGQWILPERMFPDDVREYGWDIMGKNEPWGRSKLIKNPFGDQILFRTIELFNQQFGPSPAEVLFKKPVK